MTNRQYPAAPQRIFPLHDSRLYPKEFGGAGPGGGGGGGAWSPNSLGAVVVGWYHVHSVTDINSGTSFGVLSNYASPGVTASSHATQTTSANRPFYYPDFGNIGVMQFFATSRHLKVPAGIYSGAIAAALYEVFNISSSAANGDHKFGGNASNEHWPFSDNVVYDGFAAAVRQTTTNVNSWGANHPKSGYHIKNVWSQSGDYGIRMNSNSIFVTTTNSVNFSSAPAFGVAGNQLFGYSREMVLLNTVLSSADNAKMEGFLAHANSIQANLPVGHPYKSSPP